MFRIKYTYGKTDIYRILHVPTKAQKGAWNTGYREYKNAIYIFANIGVPGRTGHDYDNELNGESLIWYSKTKAKIHQPLIRRMLDPATTVHIFIRDDARAHFTYIGVGKAKEVEVSSPIRVTWVFPSSNARRKNSKTDPGIITDALDDNEKKRRLRDNYDCEEVIPN